MRRLILFFLIWILVFPVQSQEQVEAKNDAYHRLLRLLAEKDFFRLEQQFHLLRKQMDPAQQLHLQAYLDNAFNRNKAAVRHLELLHEHYSSLFSGAALAAFYELQADSYFKLFQYAKAAESDSILLSRYLSALDSNKISEIKNLQIIYRGLRNIPPQQVTVSSTTLNWKKDKIGIIEIPIKRKHRHYEAVFDTRANISVITQTFARTLELQTLPVFYYQGSSITGIRFRSSLAVADSLFIGGILVRHAVFQVVPDSVLYIAPVGFQMNILIGFPIIGHLGEIHFYREGKMEFRLSSSKREMSNLALDGLNPVIPLRTTSGDTLCFAFDFGASQSTLFAAYYQKYKDFVLAKGKRTDSEIGGAGGAQVKDVLTLPSVDLYFGGKKIALDSVDVLSEKIYPEESFYGNIGQDFVRQFRELVIDFEKMYIKGY